jgi:hypothetical protein
MVEFPNDRRSRHARRDLFKKFQPFAADAVFEQAKTGGVAARPRQALDQSAAYRIDDTHEHDRYCAGCLLQRPDDGGTIRQDDIRRERD